ncbi:MAG: DegT/DnrJ/EryC1/StrS family aminotransferase, partial [Candidatus Paceibacterota bacterium]
IETNQVQIRNDVYQLTGGIKQNLPNMNNLEDKYVSLPIHNNLSEEDIYKVVEAVKEYVTQT